jgi:hypothetical protein
VLDGGEAPAPVELRRVQEAAGEDEQEGEGEVDATPLLLGPFDERLLARLTEILPKHASAEAGQEILKELRLTLIEGRTAGSDLNALRLAVSRCRRCPNLEGPPRSIRGNIDNPDVVVVMESLTVSDEAVSSLAGLMADCGYPKGRAALTGVTRCAGKSDAGNVENCREYLLGELEFLTPGLVVPLGSAPTQVLCGRGVKVTEARGKIWWAGPLAVMPTYSPAFASRSENKLAELKADLTFGARFLYGS